MSCYTVTLGDRAENEVRMEMIGEAATYGLRESDLERLYADFKKKNWNTRFYSLPQLLPDKDELDVLTPPATLLVLKNGVDRLLGDGVEKKLFDELESMPKDTTSWAYGKVQPKHARHNNCLATYEQAPDIANKKGTVVNYKKYHHTASLFEAIMDYTVDYIDHRLVGELNHYYDATKCYIGFHGDSERKIVVGVRSGPGADGFPLKFQWYRNREPVGDTGYIPLNRGDIYFMSEKAVGSDWKKWKNELLTLRHAAGTMSAVTKPKRKRDFEPPELVPLYSYQPPMPLYKYRS